MNPKAFSSVPRLPAFAVLTLLAVAMPTPGLPGLVIEHPAGTPLPSGSAIVGWGWNHYGQRDIPPGGLADIRDVAAGSGHTVALKKDGTVIAWGSNLSGETNVPAGLSDVQAIAAGSGHTVAVKSDGTVVAWGYPFNGVTDVPAGLAGVRAVAAGGLHSAALKRDGTVVAWGYNHVGQTDVPAGLSGVVAIAAGQFHTAALKNDGTIVAWGSNAWGETAVPAGLVDVREIAAGSDHTVAVKSDGTVVAWGRNHAGQTAVPAGLSEVETVAAGVAHTVALKSDGRVVAWGSITRDETIIPAGLSGVRAIRAGGSHSLALVPAARLTFADQFIHTASTPATFTIKNAGGSPLDIASVSVHGGDTADFSVNTGGMLTSLPAAGGPTTFSVTFTPGAAGARTTTLRVLSNDPDEPAFDATLRGTGITPIPHIVIEEPAGTPLVPGNVVVIWGRNIPISGPVGFTGVQAIAGGFDHALILKTGGSVMAWGGNFSGQATVPDGLMGVQAIAAGDVHNVALKSNGTVVAWGGNLWGQATVPGGLMDVAAVAAGYRHTLALKIDGTIVGWGDNSYGQRDAPAGLTGVRAISAGEYFSVALKDDGTVVAWGRNDSDQASVPAGLTDVEAIAAGNRHTVALKGDGGVVAWGWNFNGQTDVPAGLADVKAIVAGGEHSMALKRDGTVTAWGYNWYSQTNVPASLTDVQAIAAGEFHSLALVPPAPVVFAGQAVGHASEARTFTVRNAGTAAFTIGSVNVSGGHAEDFIVNSTAMPAGVPAVNGQTTFTVVFTPSATGVRSTTLRVSSNAPNQSDFVIRLSGDGLGPLEIWRRSHFGPSATRIAADDSDPNYNGISNLIEYALDGDPLGSAPGVSILPRSISDGGRLQLTFNRTPARDDITLAVQISDGPGGPWTDIARSVSGQAFTTLTAGATADETGTGNTRTVIIGESYDPARQRHFMRLVVTAP